MRHRERGGADEVRERGRAARVPHRAGGGDVEVDVGDDVGGDPFGEVFGPFGAADEAVLCRRRVLIRVYRRDKK